VKKIKNNCIEKRIKIELPTSKYVVLSRSILFIFSIMTTKMNNTAIAPTYTIRKIKPIKSECNNVNIDDAQMNMHIKHKTECIGLTHSNILAAENIHVLYNRKTTQFIT
jgi:hypothetical protein